MQWITAAAAFVAMYIATGLAPVQANPTEDEAAFRALYKELIEINTTRSVGNCTEAAEAMRKRLLAAGLPAKDMQILAPPTSRKVIGRVAV